MSFCLLRKQFIWGYNTGRVFILAYHFFGNQKDHILRITPQTFEANIETIKNKFRIISIYDLYNACVEQKWFSDDCVVITFDDGMKSQYHCALPILNKYDIKATFFIPVGLIGAKDHLTCDEIRIIADAGHHIESHSVTHRRFSELNKNEMLKELMVSSEVLYGITGVRPRFFAFPYGDYVDIKDLFIECGYWGARTTKRTEIHLKSDCDLYDLPAWEVSCDIPIEHFLYKETTTKEYWNLIYGGVLSEQKGSKYNQDLRYNEILSKIKDEKTILDVGSGFAILPKLIKSKFPDIQVVACDFSEKAKMSSGYKDYVVCDACATPFKDKEFDLVTCCQTIEFIVDVDAFLKEMKRISKAMILTTTLEPVGYKQINKFSQEELCKKLNKYGIVQESYILDNRIIFVKVVFNITS